LQDGAIENADACSYSFDVRATVDPRIDTVEPTARME
jgi:hypothetical protein